VPDCATAGVLGVTTAVVAGLMATEAVKHLAGIGAPLTGTLLSYDALTVETRKFTVAPDPGRSRVSALRDDYGASVCGAASGEDGADADARDAALARIASGTAVALDVREPHERLVADLPTPTAPLRLPMSELSPDALRGMLARGGAPPGDAPGIDSVVVFCASGRRSGDVVAAWATVAREAFGLQLRNLPGGLSALPRDTTRPRGEPTPE